LSLIIDNPDVIEKRPTAPLLNLTAGEEDGADNNCTFLVLSQPHTKRFVKAVVHENMAWKLGKAAQPVESRAGRSKWGGSFPYSVSTNPKCAGQ
jgi:hypothetical protein